MFFFGKKKSENLRAVLVGAVAGAVAAVCVIAAYEFLRTEKGKAVFAKAKATTISAAGKVRGKATRVWGVVRSKLSKNAVSCECRSSGEILEASIEP